jgi:hypothetical protein
MTIVKAQKSPIAASTNRIQPDHRRRLASHQCAVLFRDTAPSLMLQQRNLRRAVSHDALEGVHHPLNQVVAGVRILDDIDLIRVERQDGRGGIVCEESIVLIDQVAPYTLASTRPARTRAHVFRCAPSTRLNPL